MLIPNDVLIDTALIIARGSVKQTFSHDFIDEKSQITHVRGFEDNMRRKVRQALGANNGPSFGCLHKIFQQLAVTTVSATLFGSLGISDGKSPIEHEMTEGVSLAFDLAGGSEATKTCTDSADEGSVHLTRVELHQQVPDLLARRCGGLDSLSLVQRLQRKQTLLTSSE